MTVRTARTWTLLCGAAMLGACGDSEGEGGRGAGGSGGVGGGGILACEEGSIALDDGRCISPGVQPDGCPAGQWAEEGTDGPCRPAGVQSNGCDAGTLMVDGQCVPAGVPPEGCAPGFVPDGARGCEAVLPASPCAYGQMAIMGETSCRAVAPCAAGTYGDVPTDGETEFVDVSFVGVSDGTELSPWTSIQAALDAASPGDIVAIAEGVYAEDLVLDKPVRLWGRCPELVELAGGGGPASVTLGPASQGSELRDLAITSTGVGIAMAGASEIVFDRVWLHDTGDYGLDGVHGAPSTSFTMTRSLVELCYDTGLSLYGTDAVIEESVVRDTIPTASTHGWAITLQEDEGGTFKRPRMSLRSSLIERNAEVAVSVFGAEAEIDAVYIRETAPRPTGKFGRGISLQTGVAPGSEAVVTVTGSVIEASHEMGVSVTGSSITLERTVIRDTVPDDLGSRGFGVGLQFHPTLDVSSDLRMSQCLVEQSSSHGIVLGAAEATLEGVLVRETRPHAEGVFGRGLTIQSQPPQTLEGSDVTMVGCSIEDNLEAGIFVEGSVVSLDGVLVSGTDVGAEPFHGYGMVAQDDPITGERPDLTIIGSRFADNHSMGLFAAGSDLDMQGTLVSGTGPVDGGGGPVFGRGAGLQVNPLSGATATSRLRGCVFENNHEVGLFFAGGTASIEGVRVTGTLPVRGVSRGVNVQGDFGGAETSSVEMRWSVLDGGQEMGVFVVNAEFSMDSSIVRGVQTRQDGSFGDGFAIVDAGALTTATVVRSLLEGNQRAGVANFGAVMHLEDSVLRCNALDLVGEPLLQPFVFEDAGGNACGCDQTEPCRVLSSALTPPEPLAEASN